MKTKERILIHAGFITCLCMVGNADVLVGLNASGQLWSGDSTTDLTTTKQLVGTLTGGATYIDSAFDGQFVYGLRSDGAVYKSDLSGNISQVTVSGWAGVDSISAKQGTLYGKAAGNILNANGTAAVSITGGSTWVDFTVTDDNKFWMLTGGGQGVSYNYAFNNGYSGDVSGQVGFISQGNANGFAIDTDGSDLFVLREYSTLSAIYRNSTWIDHTGILHMDLATGDTDVFFVDPDGGVRSLPKAGGAARAFHGGFYSTGSSLVGLEVVPEPATFGLFGIVGAAMLFVRRRFTN